MLRKYFTILAMGMAILASPTLAADKIGTAIVNGQRVELFNDNTWAYAETQAQGCKSLNVALAFCGETAGWQATQPPAPDIIAQYLYDDRNYGQFVIEGVGSADGMTTEFMMDAVLQNAAAVTGGLPEDVPVLDVFETDVSGIPGETVVYLVDLNGLKLVFSNSIVISDNWTLQAMTFSVGDTYTDAHKALKDAFLSHTRFEP